MKHRKYMNNSSPPPRSAEHSAVANVATMVARYRSQSFTILGPPPSLPEGTGLLDDPDAIWAEEEWSQERLIHAEETEVSCCRYCRYYYDYCWCVGDVSAFTSVTLRNCADRTMRLTNYHEMPRTGGVLCTAHSC